MNHINLTHFGALCLTLLCLTACNQAQSQMAPSGISAEAQPGVPEGWITNFDAAMQQARESGRPVLVNFTGSDWCVYCKRIEAEIFSKEEFKTYAAENLVRVFLDFPMGKPQTEELAAQNKVLAGRYKVEGFPTLLLFAPDGNVIWRQVGMVQGGIKGFNVKLKEAVAQAKS